MNLLINAISAKMGGAATYLFNMLPELQRHLSTSDPGSRLIVWRPLPETVAGNWPAGIEYRENRQASGAVLRTFGSVQRLWFDQVDLAREIRREGVDVLYSSANIACLRCPCRQVLLVRNPVFFDRRYLRRQTRRGRAYMQFQRWLTLRSIFAADLVLFPTQAMLELVGTWTGGPRRNWHAAHYGTRHDLFHPGEAGTGTAQGAPSSRVRLLHVSIYSDQKNFGTLLRAMELLQQEAPGRFELRLNAGFGSAPLHGNALFSRFAEEEAIYERLHAAGAAFDGSWQKYGSLPDVYRMSDVFVFPSYTESFGHPLVEAMASGLPIVAADEPVNRELCGDAAVYFPSFDITACARAIQRVAADAELRERLRRVALERARQFTWARHVDRLVAAFRGELS